MPEGFTANSVKPMIEKGPRAWWKSIVKNWREMRLKKPCHFCKKPTGFSNIFGEWFHIECYQKWADAKEKAKAQEAADRHQIEIFKKAILETQGRSGPAEHPEASCDDCNGPNVVWSGPSELWNAVCRPEGYLTEPMLCPRCFMVRAEKMGSEGVWRIELENL